MLNGKVVPSIMVVQECRNEGGAAVASVITSKF